MLLSNEILTLSRMGGGDGGCGIGLLEVTSNNLVTFPRQNSIRPWAHAASSGECNYY